VQTPALSAERIQMRCGSPAHGATRREPEEALKRAAQVLHAGFPKVQAYLKGPCSVFFRELDTKAFGEPLERSFAECGPFRSANRVPRKGLTKGDGRTVLAAKRAGGASGRFITSCRETCETARLCLASRWALGGASRDA
jgi:hypothetical protein